MLQLAAALRDEGESRDEGPEVNQQLLQLVREAHQVIDDVYHGRDSEISLRDWLKAADPFVKS